MSNPLCSDTIPLCSKNKISRLQQPYAVCLISITLCSSIKPSVKAKPLCPDSQMLSAPKSNPLYSNPNTLHTDNNSFAFWDQLSLFWHEFLWAPIWNQLHSDNKLYVLWYKTLFVPISNPLKSDINNNALISQTQLFAFQYQRLGGKMSNNLQQSILCSDINHSISINVLRSNILLSDIKTLHSDSRPSVLHFQICIALKLLWNRIDT